MTDWVYNTDGNPAGAAGPQDQRTFSTKVEREGPRWLAVVTLADGESISKVFDTERDALRYGDELAQWLSARQERE